MSPPHRPWGDYALRVLCCVLLFASGHRLLSASTFAARLREDAPLLVAGLSGADAAAFLGASFLCLLPLVAGRAFLPVFLASAFLLSGLGAYWWTLIPWDEVVTKMGFPGATPPTPLDYLEVAIPTILAAFHVVLSHGSRMRAHVRNRGASDEEARRACAASFLMGAATFVSCLVLVACLWGFLVSGALERAQSLVPSGVAAIVVAAAALMLSYGLASGRLRTGLRLRRPSPGAAGRAAPARSRGRKSPS